MNDAAANSVIDWPRLVPAAILLASIGALASAYTAQYAFGIEPCILCLYQRIPYGAAGVLALLALFFPQVRLQAVTAAAVLFVIVGAIAFYHVGVEQHWWLSVAACGSGGGEGPGSVDELRQMLMAAAKPVKPCDAIEWTLFGLSMATYNVPVSLGLALGSFWGALQIRRSP